MSTEEVAQLKLLTIGDSGVGKTWLLLRWAGVAGKLSTYGSSMPTIGIDFKMKTTVVNGRRIKVQVWDTAGQERFRNITTSYYRHSQGVILVYDITDMTTFESIRIWMNQIKIHADASVCVVLVGNKCDLESHRMVPTSAGAALAKEFGIPFMETSAVESINVDEAFSTLTKNVYESLEAQGLLPPLFGAGVYSNASGSSGSPVARRPSGTTVNVGAKRRDNENCHSALCPF